MFSSVVVGTDGSDTATEAVRGAMEIAKLYGARLHIVTAYKPRPVHAGGVPEEFHEQVVSGANADAVLEDQCARAARRGSRCKATPGPAIRRSPSCASPSRRRPTSSSWATRE